jgi:CrcB protein
MIKNILLVAMGGGLGSVLRYLCQKWIYDLYPHPFPLGTLIVNVSGCLLIGILAGISERGHLLDSDRRLFMITGICGGFTTFSTFCYENLALLRNGQVAYFSLYTAFSVVLGLLAVFAGAAFVRMV